jgi:hypothetical protein
VKPFLPDPHKHTQIFIDKFNELVEWKVKCENVKRQGEML